MAKKVEKAKPLGVSNTQLTLLGEYSGQKSPGFYTINIPDNLRDKNFILVITGIQFGQKDISNKNRLISPYLTKEGNTITVYNILSNAGADLNYYMNFKIYYY